MVFPKLILWHDFSSKIKNGNTNWIREDKGGIHCIASFVNFNAVV